MLVALGLLLTYLYIDQTVRDSYSGMWTSSSSTEARKQKLLLREYVVEPQQLVFENYRVEFTDCWVEERTRTEHDFIFFKRLIRSGEPRLVLNYQGQRLRTDPDSTGGAMLVPGEEGYGQDVAESEYAAQPLSLAYHQMTNLSIPVNIENDTIYLSIIRRWSDKRRCQIRLYPKP